ncbi:SLAP domain-containing protein [Lactobacillus amylolyticus]|uniref:SLAP domain-containing protein n=1 Tax=Lactobacillus amylolyticus TaxID=83683 RepID=UPI0012DC3102|nr:SLAP domain-containing protein [Lactobacillus amylolyticus]
MKKNLRIVSAAAAALLAVAPVAAAAVSTVSAVTTININGNTSTPVAQNTDVNLATNFTALAYVAGQNGAPDTKGVVSGSITATYNGQSYTGNLTAGDASDTTIYRASDNTAVDPNTSAFGPGQYYAVVRNVSFNFGSQNAGKTLTVSLKDGLLQKAHNNTPAEKVTVTLDKNGVASFASVKTPCFKAVDPFSTSTVAWYQNNNVVTSANVTVNAGSNNLVNVRQIVAALNGYTPYELSRGNTPGEVSSNALTSPITADAVTDQLKAQNIAVDDAGYFTAPTSLSLKFTATANDSNASAELPVTVSIPNGKVTTEPSVSKTVMHAAYYYDKNGKRVGTDMAATYSSVNLVSDSSASNGLKTYTINGKSYYKIANEDKYIVAGNVTGTSRTLKHNAYVYKTSKKRANKVTLKKGSSVTTYGSAVKLANGKLYYRIGKTQYVKVANF